VILSKKKNDNSDLKNKKLNNKLSSNTSSEQYSNPKHNLKSKK
jgi:hypothetical protein